MNKNATLTITGTSVNIKMINNARNVNLIYIYNSLSMYSKSC